MTWLLDTDMVIRAIRGWPVNVRERVDQTDPTAVVVSAVTIAELWFGAHRYENPERRRAVFDAFLEPYEILSFDRGAAEVHGDLRFLLRHAPIGERDLLIASIALTHGMTVVTNNVREFNRVPGLSVEDWSQ